MSGIHSIVVDHDTAGARRLGRANNPDAGLLVATAPPDLRRRFEFSWCLLEALGKDPRLTGRGKHDGSNWEVLHAWLAAHPIGDLVLIDAQSLAPRFVADLCGLVATAGIDLWLIAHRPAPPSYLDALERWPHHDGGQAELARLVAAAEAHPPAPEPASYPDVPADNWPTFRHAAAATDPDRFEIVDATYRAAFAAALGELAGADLDEETLLAYIRRQLNACAQTGEMITVVRAIQAAAHRCGWHVHADPAQLIATATEMSRAARRSPDTWRRVRAYREPHRGAAAALAACGLTIGAMLELTVSDISDDGATVRADGETIAVPDGADLFLRAQLTHRAIMGADEHEPLFSDDNSPISARALADALRLMATEISVPVPAQATSRAATVKAATWRYRWGLSVQRLR